ncbi:MAG: phosphatidylserine decarboxylase family protein [Flavobacteriales bacterium]|jgi:phosphatidylserine decarboxylase
MTIHKEGFKILTGTILTLVALNVALAFLTDIKWIHYAFYAVSFILFFLVAQFFRLPKRNNTAQPDELVAPCDGKVVVIEEVEEPEFFQGKRIQVSIFMSPINVHANWVPCEGTVKYVKYHPGLFLVAWHPKSSTENERSTVVIERKPGQDVLLRQVAGAVARRIIYYVKPDQKVNRNEQFGFIKFGSRVDLYFPLGTEIVSKIGDVTAGNETVIARWAK